jgi:hypothetical protein
MYEGLLDVMEATDSLTLGKTIELKAGGEPFAGMQRSSSKETTEGKHESMIPHDLVLRDVLKKIKEEKFIIESPQNAKIGNIVLIQGELVLVDPNLIINLMKSVPKMLEDNFNQAASKGGKRGIRNNSEAKNLTKAFLSMLGAALDSVHPVTQFRIATAEVEAWGTIVQEHMRKPINCLLMQHGQIIPGLWSMLGIVDNGCSSPKQASVRPLPPMHSGLEEALDGMRMVFEVPNAALSVTPLVIFRQIIGE